MPCRNMHRTVANFLIALLALVVYQEQSVDSHYVAQHSPRRAVARSGLQTVQGPKFQSAKPYTHKTHANKSKLRQLHYIPYIKKQRILTTQHRAKKHTGHTHRNNLIPLRPHLYTVHAITVLPQTLHQLKKTPKLVYVATTPRPRLVANKTHDVAHAIKEMPLPHRPSNIKLFLPAPAHALQPPVLFAASTTTETATIMTTPKPKRVKRIWPTDMTTMTTGTTDKVPSAYGTNSSIAGDATAASVTPEPALPSASSLVELTANVIDASSTVRPAYSRFMRKPKITISRPPTTNVTQFDEWVPILSSHVARRRSDSSSYFATPARPFSLYAPGQYSSQVGYTSLYADPHTLYARDPYLNSKFYSGYSGSRGARIVGDTLVESSGNHHVVTKIKHHHHHHHHKYVKTVEKPVRVPVKVVVPKPYPVERKVPVPVERIVHKVVEKKVPVPYPVEKKVPYPIEIKVPHPYPVKVIEKEYIPKPYPVTVPVPVIKHIEVKVPQPFPVPYEKQVPYPVEVKVPVHVEKRVPYPVEVEKKVKVPYPVPVKVYVPHPYPVEKKVPYPVEVKVKDPVTVVQHIPVPVKVYVDKPYVVKVPQAVPVAVEKRVPYPVEVENKVPYPVEVEKKVLYPVKVYVPQPVSIPVEKRSPYPVEVKKKLPYPVKVYDSHQVPIETGIPINAAGQEFADETTAADRVKVYLPHAVPLEKTISVYIDNDFPLDNPPQAEQKHESVSAALAPHTVTIHGNGNFKGFS